MSKVLLKSVTDYIFFSDIVKTNQHSEKLIDSITFTSDILTYSPIPVRILDSFVFFDTVNVGGVKRNISLITHINFTQRVGKLYQYSIIDTISFIEPSPPLIDTLEFVQILIVQNSINISDIITFTEVLIANTNKYYHLAHKLNFNSHVSAYNIPKRGRPQDQIYIDTLPITRKTFIKFTAIDNSVYTLYRPSFGNTYKTLFNHIQSETRGRTLILAANNTYPYVNFTKTVNMTFEYMKQQEGQGFLDYLNKYLGQPLTLVDHENISCIGFISTPEIQLIQRDKNNYSLEFELEILPVE